MNARTPVITSNSLKAAAGEEVGRKHVPLLNLEEELRQPFENN